MSAAETLDSEAVCFSSDPVTGIAVITLNRARSLNAINVALLTSLVSCLGNVKATKPRVCILTGSGTSFCSGEDLKETLAPRSNGTDPDELRLAFEQLQDITRIITTTDTVFVAAVNGWAVGGGAEIALAADVVIASPGARFKFPEITHGHAPTGGISRLPQLIGLQQAKRLMLFGDAISANEALSLNMIAEVAHDPLARSKELAIQLSKKSGRSLATIKLGIERATFPNIEAVLDYEVQMASWSFADELASDSFKKFKDRKDVHKTATSISHRATIPSLLKDIATSHANRVFLRFGSSDFTYATFYQNVSALAHGLSEAGVHMGDVVAAMMVNSEEMVRFWFATMFVGAIWAPLHTEFRGLTLRRALELVKPKIMIVDEAFLPYLPSGIDLNLFVKGETLTHKHWSSLIRAYRLYPAPHGLSPQSTTSLLFTSGTTGPSKACELNHQYFISVGRALIDSLRLTSSDVLFCPFPLCHADASSLTVIPALLIGATAAVSERFSASSWWNEIRETKATVADFMGATLSILYKAPPKASDADNTLRLMWGVPVPSWAADFEKRFDLRIYEVYGSTETGLPVVQPVDLPRIKGSCGVALNGIDIKIIGVDGSDVAPGIVGELIVRQPASTRFSGYYKNAEATNSSLRNDWFYTGDLCRMDARGNLFFVGRRKYVIRRRGENISAFEVEEGLLLHPDILECAVYGVPADELTEEDLAVSVMKRPGTNLTEGDVHAFATKTMAKFQVPRFIRFCDTLPRTSTGKLEIFKLQEAWAQKRNVFKDFEQRIKGRL